MEAWLSYPEVQSAAVPFGLALVCLLLLRRFAGIWASLSVLVGMAAAVYLITGFQFFPLNSTRKILAVACGFAAFGLIAEFLPWRRALGIAAALAGAAGAVWVLWPLLIRDTGGLPWWQGAVGALYVASAMISAEWLRSRADAASITVSAIGFGAGGAALLGATALYGQLGLAAGSASAAAALLTLFGAVVVMSRAVTYSLVALSSLLAVGAVTFSNLVFYSLIPLFLTPWLAALPWLARLQPRAYRIAVAVLVGVAVAVAVGIAWKTSGPPPY